MIGFPSSKPPRRARSPHRLLRAFVSGAFFFVIGSFLRAEENPLKIDLISSVTSVQPGVPFRVGLHLQHPRGYHTYWKFPGIVGVPTNIDWKLPSGWKASPIEWPAPERVFMFQIKAQGFEEEVVLPIVLTPPKKLDVGGTVELKGKATWMACARTCHPGFKDLSLSLPVSAQSPAVDRKWAELFQAAAAAVATPCDQWKVTASTDGKELVMVVSPQSAEAAKQLRRIKSITFFTDDGIIDPNKPENLKVADDSLTLTQTISEYAPKPLPKRLHGILQCAKGWLADGQIKNFTVDVPLSK